MKSVILAQFKVPALFFCGLATTAAFAHSTGAPTGYSGAPGDDTCVDCHVGNLNSGPGSVTITFPDPNGWVAGKQYAVLVTVADPTARRWGFELTNRKESTNLFEGAFAVPSGSNKIQIEKQDALQYVTHTVAGTFQLQTTSASWSVNWTAPAAGTGTVRFYAAGNAANNDGNTTGDKIYSTNLAVAEQTASTNPPGITVGNTVLPQFVFGGGWYSAMYFTNQGTSAANFNVNLYTDAGAAMNLAGSAVQSVSIPAGGTAIIEAPNSGALTQGWTTFNLPTGVTGYGVFRQSVSGVADQEAVVPFASSGGAVQQLTFDETNYTTALAVWYNGSAAGTVTLTASDASGNQLGTATLAMEPGTKQAFALRSQIAAIAGLRGSVVATASSGSVAMLGIRFNGSAFTSIPAAQ
jgi:hypothetical protein